MNKKDKEALARIKNKQILITSKKHPATGKVGRVVDAEIAEGLGKWMLIVEIPELGNHRVGVFHGGGRFID